ncbi:MAG: NAD(P)H-hydrate dehydratase [Clostridia bacterium]|nr:NAD(P)H-hydrate dehydratase [Clostridia bacterium]
MKLATPDMIPKIDKYAAEKLGFEPIELMRRSAEAVKEAITENYPEASKVLILAGKGNNGGDGYALSCILSAKDVVVCDLFSAGQRTDEGKFWLNKAFEQGIRIINGQCGELYNLIEKADVIVDAIFGTGFTGEPDSSLFKLASAVNSSGAVKIAIDVPLGINALDGSVCSICIPAQITVALSYQKPGLLSYPARAYIGKLLYSDLGLPRNEIEEVFDFSYRYVDFEEAKALMPERKDNSNKGSFGKTLLITGSDSFRGAAHLSVEAALRGGCGIVHFAGSEELCTELRMRFPEAIYHSLSLLNKDLSLALSEQCASVLIGSGSSVSRELCLLVEYLVENTSARLVLDADAINSLAKYSSPEILTKARKKPVITPHPLELSRLSGIPVAEIEKNRLSFAKEFAKKYNCILLLKGALTIVTDGEAVYINGSGSSALAKGGSGDVLSGLIASQLAFSESAIKAAALAAYVHGRAGDILSEELSSFGVTPSDLPREMARGLSEIEKSIS